MPRTGRPRQSLEDRFYKKYPHRPPDECWINPKQNHSRYGTISVGGAKGKMINAHIVSYEMHVGPVPEGMVLDHKCRNKPCANWRHLEPVTNRENILRGMSPTAVAYRNGTCLEGHSMEDAYVKKNGDRQCRTCQLAKGAAYRAAKREKARSAK